MKKQLVMLKGLPASGKSTYAKAWVDESPKTRVRVNMDDIRSMVYSGEDIYQGYGSKVEDFVLAVCIYSVEVALEKGLSVIVDNLNFGRKHEPRYRKMAQRRGAEFLVHVMDTPLEVCLERNRNRKRQIPEHRIIQIAEQFNVQ